MQTRIAAHSLFSCQFASLVHFSFNGRLGGGGGGKKKKEPERERGKRYVYKVNLGACVTLWVRVSFSKTNCRFVCICFVLLQCTKYVTSTVTGLVCTLVNWYIIMYIYVNKHVELAQWGIALCKNVRIRCCSFIWGISIIDSVEKTKQELWRVICVLLLCCTMTHTYMFFLCKEQCTWITELCMWTCTQVISLVLIINTIQNIPGHQYYGYATYSHTTDLNMSKLKFISLVHLT